MQNRQYFEAVTRLCFHENEIWKQANVECAMIYASS